MKRTTHTATGRVHTQRTYVCSCSRVVTGNGAKASHRRFCGGFYLAPMDAYYALRDRDVV